MQYSFPSLPRSALFTALYNLIPHSLQPAHPRSPFSTAVRTGRSQLLKSKSNTPVALANHDHHHDNQGSRQVFQWHHMFQATATSHTRHERSVNQQTSKSWVLFSSGSLWPRALPAMSVYSCHKTLGRYKSMLKSIAQWKPKAVTGSRHCCLPAHPST